MDRNDLNNNVITDMTLQTQQIMQQTQEQKQEQEQNIYYYIDFPSSAVEGQKINIKIPDGRTYGVVCPKLIPQCTTSSDSSNNNVITTNNVAFNNTSHRRAMVLLPSQKPPNPAHNLNYDSSHHVNKKLRSSATTSLSTRRRSDRVSIPTHRYNNTSNIYADGFSSDDDDFYDTDAQQVKEAKINIGRKFQAQIPSSSSARGRGTRDDDLYEGCTRAEYDLVWDPKQVVKDENEDEINLFLELIESKHKELAYLSLHESSYNVNEAKRLFTLKQLSEKGYDDRYESWTFEQIDNFNKAMMKVAALGFSGDNTYSIESEKNHYDEGITSYNNFLSMKDNGDCNGCGTGKFAGYRRREAKKKSYFSNTNNNIENSNPNPKNQISKNSSSRNNVDNIKKSIKVGFLEFLSHKTNRTPLACMIYFYNTYKGSQAEKEFYRHQQNNSQEFCCVCGKDGFFICCENCYRPFHLECVTPHPLEKVPDHDWYCHRCCTQKEEEEGFLGVGSAAVKRNIM